MTTACIALLALAAGVLAVFSFQKAEQQRAVNDRIASQVLATEADARLSSSPSQSIALALEAWRRSHTPQARAALLNQYLALAGTTIVEDGLGDSGTGGFAASADGRVLVLLVPRGERRTVSVVTVPDQGAERVVRLSGVPQEADAVDVSDDGGRVAVAGGNGEFAVWESEGRRWDRAEAGSWAPVRNTEGLSTSRLDFSPDGRRLLHLVTGGSAESCGTAGGWRTVWTTEPGTRRVDSVTGRLKGSRCVTDAALVTNGGDVALVWDGPRAKRASVGIETHSPGAPDWSLSDVAAAHFAPGGRGVVVSDGDYTMTAAYLLDGAGRLSARIPTATHDDDPIGWAFDHSGRFLVRSRFAGWTLVFDPREHRAHQVRSPSDTFAYTEGVPLSVVPRPGTSPWVFWGVGNDLVRSAGEPVRADSGPEVGDYGSEPMLLTRDHAVYAMTESEKTKESVITVLPRRTDGRLTRLTASSNVVDWQGYGTLTTDDAYFGFWNSEGLGYFRLSDPAARILTMPHPGLARSVLDAAPLSDSEVAVLTKDGLHRFSIVDRTSPPELIPGAPCAARGENALARETCLALVARPEHPGEVAVLFEDGRIELWRLQAGATRRLGAVEAGVDTSYYGTLYEEEHMAFLNHGDGLLVSSFGWTSLWRFDRKEPVWSVSAPDIDMTVTFLNSGVFYATPYGENIFHPVKVSDDADPETVPGVFPGVIAVHGRTMEYMVGYQILKIPLQGQDLAKALCAALNREYDPPRPQQHPPRPRSGRRGQLLPLKPHSLSDASVKGHGRSHVARRAGRCHSAPTPRTDPPQAPQHQTF